MKANSLRSILESGQYAISDLGDGTAVLTSLSNSQIISLNTLGSRIVSALIESDSENESEIITRVIDDLAKDHDVSKQQLESDVAGFLSGLRKGIESQ